VTISADHREPTPTAADGIWMVPSKDAGDDDRHVAAPPRRLADSFSPGRPRHHAKAAAPPEHSRRGTQ